MPTKKISSSWYDKFIIDADNETKQYFDAFILLLVGYSCITTMYSVAFADEHSLAFEIASWVVDAFFLVDILLNFLHAKKQDLKPEVRELREIAKIYIMSWFFIDFISVFPFSLIIGEDGVAAKLLRLFRMPRMIKLLDKKRVKKIITGGPKNQNNSTDKIVRDFLFMYGYEILRLIIMASILVYFVGSLTYLVSERLTPNDQESFIENFGLLNYGIWHRLILSCYFSLTMLSTVGYGDFYPISNNEMLYCVIVMLCGVAFFSYIMATLFDIMSTYKEKTGTPDLTKELDQWLLTLQRYNKSPLQQSIHDQIKGDMKYYWNNDKLLLMRPMGTFEIDCLPYIIRRDIVCRYIYKNIVE